MSADIIGAALSRIRTITDVNHSQILRAAEIAREDRELLLSAGWLQEIIRGWYLLIWSDMFSGDTTAWYANFWDFVRIYIKQRFNDGYCLSAKSSLDLHTDNTIVPKQVIAIVKQGAGLRTLPHNTSLLTYVDIQNFPKEITQKQGINVMPLPYALCKVPSSYFRNNPRDAELALRSITTSDEISRVLIRYNLKAAASRIMGAYQFLKDDEMAANIKKDLMAANMTVNPSNPFQQTKPLLTRRLQSTFADRIVAMWEQARDSVIKYFPSASGLPKDPEKYLQEVDKIYPYDAYNSLSIEGYEVTFELINRVKNKQWNPSNFYDNNVKNEMAAKNYYDAFQEVKASIEKIIRGENATDIVKKNLQNWYQNLFRSSVQAGIEPAESLLGYRDGPIFIRNSRHLPPPKEAAVNAMDAFFDCLKKESHPGVKAVLGHYFFVFIHPYMDGNGRMSRFLMNAFFASGGYPWTVIHVENRNKYITILENTHIQFDMQDFTNFIKTEMITQEAPFSLLDQ